MRLFSLKWISREVSYNQLTPVLGQCAVLAVRPGDGLNLQAWSRPVHLSCLSSSLPSSLQDLLPVLALHSQNLIHKTPV